MISILFPLLLCQSLLLSVSFESGDCVSSAADAGEEAGSAVGISVITGGSDIISIGSGVVSGVG